jgi:hypothetical protein
MAFALLAIALAATSARADDEETTDGEPEEIEDLSNPIARGTEKGSIGLGIILGEPTGITARLYLTDDQAIQAAVGSAFFGGGLQVHADYVFHPYILQTRDAFVIATYIGPGARVIQYLDGRDDANDQGYLAIGARAVAGLLFDFQIPLDAFVEVAGVLEYGFADGKGIGAALNAGAGARYYF